MERYTDDSLLPLSGLQHFAFCKRQWALIHIERQWDENLLTVESYTSPLCRRAASSWQG